MKRVIIIFIVLLVLCNCNESKEGIITENATTFKIEPTDELFQWNDFVDSIEIIPLETSDNSLLGWFHKGFIEQNDIYIFDLQHQTLLNFDISGHFKRKIGQKGQGPGDFLDIRDFCVTDSLVYTLDYGKIHKYDRKTGKHRGYWRYDMSDGLFNPVNFLIFDENNYYLWASDPQNWSNTDDITYYRMRKIKNGKIVAKYFKYDYSEGDDPRFYRHDSLSYYIKPITGKDIVYKITKDSISALYVIDFGDKALSAAKILSLTNNNDMNRSLYKSNTFKHIYNVLDISHYTYFECIGPEGKLHECIINKQTGEIRLGKWDYKNCPWIFFADKNVLYGYFDAVRLCAMKNETNINSCFNIVKDKLPDIKEDDNCIIIKIYLK